MPLADINMYVAMKQERWAGMKQERDIEEVIKIVNTIVINQYLLFREIR